MAAAGGSRQYLGLAAWLVGVVRVARQACLDATGCRVRAGLDRPICGHGGRGVARMAPHAPQ